MGHHITAIGNSVAFLIMADKFFTAFVLIRRFQRP